MCEGEKVEGKIQFNGNLALFRVCAITLIVNLVGLVAGLLFSVGQDRFFLASLWNALTTSSLDDFIGMVGLFIASGIGIPVMLGFVAFVAAFALSIYALVKKKVVILKIYAVLLLIWIFLQMLAIDPISALDEGVRQIGAGTRIANSLMNVYIVVAVSIFFIESKRAEKIVDVGGNLNLGLLRFCAAIFIVSGLNGFANAFLLQSFSWTYVPFCVLIVVAAVFALVKKNLMVLVVGSLMMFVQIICSMFQVAMALEWNALYFVNVAISFILNPAFVACVASFFVEPERIKRYFQ
ncbi:MAG: hypothetical protein II835_18290 [Fibrobacter sp.]|nr:hypothetical protein [Fibrobacter sp.]